MSTGIHFSLLKVTFESASKGVPNDCNDMFWCISITNHVKSYKKYNEKAQTAKFTVFTVGSQLRIAKNRKTGQTKTFTQIFKYYAPSRGVPCES